MAIDTEAVSQDERTFGVTHWQLQFTLWQLPCTEKILLDTFNLPLLLMQRKEIREIL